MKYKVIQNIKYLIKSQSNLYIHSPFVYDFYNSVIKNLYNKSNANDGNLQNNLGSEGSKNKQNILTDYLTSNNTLRNIVESPVTEKVQLLILQLISQYKLDEFILINKLNNNFLQIYIDYNLSINLKGLERDMAISFMKEKKIGIKGLMLSLSGNKSSIDPLIESILNNVGPQSVIVLTDLYENENSAALWKKIQEDARVILTLDLFEAGIVFFTPLIKRKQNFVLRF